MHITSWLWDSAFWPMKSMYMPTNHRAHKSQEHFLMAEHRRETAARKDIVNAVVNANAAASAAAAAAMTAQADGQAEDEIPDDGFEARPPRGLTISYYAVDYPRFFDALQLKLHHMRKALKVWSQ